MTALEQAARQALKALEEYQNNGAPFLACDAAVAALRKALEHQQKQEQEPAAWISKHSLTPLKDFHATVFAYGHGDFGDATPLYTHPLPTSAEYAMGYAEGFNDACKPADGWVMVPRRPTPEMITAGRDAPMCATAAHAIIEDYVTLYEAMLAASPAVEAKLKEKNT